jgi:SAM-dependent methyltransferase
MSIETLTGRDVTDRNEASATSATLATRVLDLIGASWMSQAICTAAELRIPELIAGGSQSIDELARETHCHRESLHRLLRGLATLGLCVEAEDGSFTLTPSGSLLRSDDPWSVRANAIWWGRYLWPVWGNLVETVRSGVSVRELHAGQKGYSHIEDNPEAAAVFNRKMAELTRLAAGEIMRAYDFAHVRRLIDVGGGRGELLTQLLAANPGMRGVLFDLPHAIGIAQERIADAGLSGRCECVAGSFFDEVPAGADVYLLKNVLHNWDNEKCVRILGNCRRVMRGDAKLVLIEWMRPPCAGVTAMDQALARTDLNMLVGLGVGGRERSQVEFDTLLQAAGFHAARFHPSAMELWVIEARPRLPASESGGAA